MSLRLRTIGWDAPDGRQAVLAFGTWRKAARHLCDHVLSHPERQGWRSLLEGEARRALGDGQRRPLAQAAWAPRDDGAALQALYDAWLPVLAEAGRTATALGWSQRDVVRGLTSLLGHSGVELRLTTDAAGSSSVVSAQLPGLGRANATNAGKSAGQADEARRRDPLPRDEPGRACPVPVDRSPEGRWRLYAHCARAWRAAWFRQQVLVPAPIGTLVAAVASFERWQQLSAEAVLTVRPEGAA